ncbi:MAG: AMP-binding protein [Myxococcota bacterium]
MIQLAQLLRQGALRWPARLAVVGAETRTYGELSEEAARFAGALRKAGVSPGDRVALSLRNGVEFLVSLFGTLSAGATVVPIAPQAPAREQAFRLEHARCQAWVTHATSEAVPVISPDAREAPLELCAAPGGLALILYTSGTTGTPKGAAITHASLLSHTAALVHHTLRLSSGDVVLAALPMIHSFGMRMTVFAPFFAGARLALPPPGRFDANASLATCAAEGVTWLPGVPTMFNAWGHTEGTPLSSLRWGLSAGAPLPQATRERAERRLGAEVREGYGLTEATFSTIDRPGDGPPGTVGRPVWGVEIQLDGDPVGEIMVRGQNVMREYLDDPESTRAVFREGWLRTGDLGTWEGGRLRVVDRLKDLILRGGHNVVPAKVENVLAEYPDLQSVAVVGRNDPHYGEEIVAVVVPTKAFALEAFAAFVQAEFGAANAPRELALVDALPLGPSRKVLRRVLRTQIEEGTLAPIRLPRGE